MIIFYEVLLGKVAEVLVVVDLTGLEFPRRVKQMSDQPSSPNFSWMIDCCSRILLHAIHSTHGSRRWKRQLMINWWFDRCIGRYVRYA